LGQQGQYFNMHGLIVYPHGDNMASTDRSEKKRGASQSPQPAVVTREEVGARLRAIRKAREMTLKMLSAKSGIALSTISKMELGQIAVSYEKFGAIARTLKVDVSRLFDAEAGAESNGQQPTVVKTSLNAGTQYIAGNYNYQMLGADFPGKIMTPMLGQVLSRDPGQFAEFIRHPGQEFVMVLSGRVKIQFESGESIELKARESAYFNSSVGHIYLSVGRGDAQIVVVCSDM
jgi:transcriptional regulator with XRE-family HTH domain